MGRTFHKIGPFGEQLDYSRMSAFGSPFVDPPPLLPDDELARQSKQYLRFGYANFNTSRRAERIYGRTYGEIMEGVVNRDMQLIHKSPPVVEADGSVSLYVEWAEPMMLHEGSSLPPRREDTSADTMAEQRPAESQYIRLPNRLSE